MFYNSRPGTQETDGTLKMRSYEWFTDSIIYKGLKMVKGHQGEMLE